MLSHDGVKMKGAYPLTCRYAPLFWGNLYPSFIAASARAMNA